MTSPLAPTLLQTLARFRRETMRGEAQTLKQLADAYAKIYRRLQDDLELELRRIFAQSESVVTRAYVTRRLERLTEQVYDELQKYQTVLASTVDVSTDAALMQGSKHAAELMRLATLGQRNVISIAFNKLNPVQVNTMIAFLSPTSPLYKRIDLLAKYHAPVVRDQLIEAIAKGYNPYKTAGNIEPFLRAIADEFKIDMARPFADAVRMARTAQIWSYRESTRANYQANSDVVSGWQWFAQVDDPDTCVSCLAMHGTIHDLDEPLDDHYHGRCTPIPVVLGQALIPETAGEDYFNGLSEDEQRARMGNGAFDAWQAGKFELSQLSHEVEDDIYGLMRSVTPLKDLIRESEG